MDDKRKKSGFRNAKLKLFKTIIMHYVIVLSFFFSKSNHGDMEP